MIKLKAAAALNIKVSPILKLIKLADNNLLSSTGQLYSRELLFIVFLECWAKVVDDVWLLDCEGFDVCFKSAAALFSCAYSVL